MFKIIVSLTIALMGALAQAQVKETRNVEAFSKMKVSESIEVIVSDSALPTVVVETASESSQSAIVATVKNNTLYLRNSNPNQAAKVWVGGPISEIRANGAKITLPGVMKASDLTIDLSESTLSGNLSAHKLTLTAKSKSVVNLRLDVDKVSGHIQTGSRASLSGNADRAILSAGNRSLCHARNLIANNVSVDAGENATVLVSANNELDVNLLATSNVRYFGKPSRIRLPDSATTQFVERGRLVSLN